MAVLLVPLSRGVGLQPTGQDKQSVVLVTTAKQLAAEINKVLGQEVVFLGNDPKYEVTRIPTGVFPIDYLLDGGIPRGRFTEVFGDYSTLKTYVGLRAIREEQLAGGVCAVVDTEHSYDSAWAEEVGCDPKTIIVQRPATGEEAVDVTEVLIRNGATLVVWDSVAATLPKTEQEKMAGDKVQPARQAELMSRAMRKLNAANDNTALLFINQTRINVGQMFGSPEVVPGGKALPFYASYRVALRRGERLRNKETKQVTGFKINATIEKHKLAAASMKTVSFTWDTVRNRVDDLDFMLALAADLGLELKQGNSKYKLPWWETWVNGRDKFLTTMTEEDAERLRGYLSLGGVDPLKKKVVRRRKT